MNEIIRDATEHDYSEIIRLNLESEHFLSELNFTSLSTLHTQAAYHRVLTQEGKIKAFLLAFREGASYDSPNYCWFAKKFTNFLYIDRVVVDASAQGNGFGTLMYKDLFKFARQTNANRITCEFDINPPNEKSRRFHAKFGFKEVGSQAVAKGKKTVSLQEINSSFIIRRGK